MNNAKDHFNDELISAYLDDELSPSERQRVEQMLHDDHQRRRTFEQFQALSENLRSLPDYQPEDSFQRQVLERLRGNPSKRPRAVIGSGLSTGRPRDDTVSRIPKRALAWRPAAVGLASLAAALLLMFFLTHGGFRPTVALHSTESTDNRSTSPAEPVELDKAALALDSVSESEFDDDALANTTSPVGELASADQLQQLAAQTDSDYIVQVATVSPGEDLSRFLKQNSLVPAPNSAVPQSGFYFLPQLGESSRETLRTHRSLSESLRQNGNRVASSDRETGQFLAADPTQQQNRVRVVLAEGTADQVRDAINGLRSQSQWFQRVSVLTLPSKLTDSRGQERVTEGADDRPEAGESRSEAPAAMARSAANPELHERLRHANELAASSNSKKSRRSDTSDNPNIASAPAPGAEQLQAEATKPVTSLAAPKAAEQQQNGNARLEKAFSAPSREIRDSQATENAREPAMRGTTATSDAKIISGKATSDHQLVESLKETVDVDSSDQLGGKRLLGAKKMTSGKLRILFLVVSPETTPSADVQSGEPPRGPP